MAGTKLPSRPVMSALATSALRIASSIAWTTASKNGSSAASGRKAALRHRPRRGRQRLPIRGGEGEEDVAGRVVGIAAGERHAERRPAGEPLQLVRQQRRVGGDDADDRALVLLRRPLDQGRLGEGAAEPQAPDGEVAAAAEIRLDEGAER